MKKFLAMTLIATFVCTVFVGCSTTKTYKDGKYTAEYAEADNHGWTDYVEVTVESGKISKVDFDSKSAEGVKKTEDKSYAENMRNAGSNTVPSEFYPKLAQELVDKQKIDEVDSIAGATTTSSDFKKLVKELEKSMEKGDTATLKVAR